MTKAVTELLAQNDTLQIGENVKFVEAIKEYRNEDALAIINDYESIKPNKIAEYVQIVLNAKFPVSLEREGENRNLVVLEKLLSLMNVKCWERAFEQNTRYSTCGYVLKFLTDKNKKTVQMCINLLIKHGATMNRLILGGWYSVFDHTDAIRRLFDIEADKHQALGAGILTAFENTVGGSAVSGFINIIQQYVPTTMEFEVLEVDGKSGKITL